MFKVTKRINRWQSGVFIINFEYIWLVSSVFFEFENINAELNTLLP